MIDPDVRTAAQAEAEKRWMKFAPSDTRQGAFESDAFVAGAVWGAALVSEGIMISDFQGDGVYRDQQGRIWQPLDDTRAAVEATITITEARVTPTREQIAKVLYDKHPRAQTRPWNETPRMTREIYLEDADAVLALMQGMAEEGS